MGILSEAEVASFHTEGVLVPEFRLPIDRLARLQSLATRLIADNPHLGDEPVASPHVPGSGVQNVKSDPGWIEIPTCPPLLDMVEQLIGPDIILWGTTLFHKPARARPGRSLAPGRPLLADQAARDHLGLDRGHRLHGGERLPSGRSRLARSARDRPALSRP